MVPEMTELISIDYRAQDDLLFWEEMSRAMTSAASSGRRIGLILGSGEHVQRELETAGHDGFRSKDVFDLAFSHADALEKSFREENRRCAGMLTDSGVFSVGIMGSDRGILKVGKEGVIASEKVISRLWQAPGIVLVLSTLGRRENGDYMDIYPLSAALAVSSVLSGECRITHLAQHITDSMKRALESDATLSLTELHGQDIVPSWWNYQSKMPEFSISHVSWLGAGKRVKTS